jgi:hypothetical protein
MKFRALKGHGNIYKFHLNRIFFYGAFKYGDGGKFRGYVGTNTEPLWVQFL